ncbi:transporter substrate-binding domain-containing protein [Lachnospiraceae bacterium ZAX-1]
MRHARIPYLLLAIAFLLFTFAGDFAYTRVSAQETYTNFASYRDIPSVTKEDIAAVEALREQFDSFTYGMLYSTETFDDQSGNIQGYSTLFCNWLTDLFGIPFKPSLCEWNDLISGLASHEIDFTGELTATDARRKTYYMTDAIAERSLKYMRIKGSDELSKIAEIRPLRYACLSGSTTLDLISPLVDASFDIVLVDDYARAYQMLNYKAIDAFIDNGVSEAAFDKYENVVSEDFFPLIYSPVSCTTQNSNLEPIITVLQKALQGGSMRHLIELYNLGQREYLRHKLFLQLSEEEQAYITEHIYRGFPIPLAAECDNYPISFYNDQEKEWQGIAIDVLNEVESLTGLTFERPYDDAKTFPTLLSMLENGELALITELIRTDDREGRFLWTDNAYLTDYFVLLSKAEFRDLNMNEILYAKIGLIQNTAYAELFLSWFPNQMNTVTYQSNEEAFTALEDGEIDLLMSSRNFLLNIANYEEKPGFKANIVFDLTFDSLFGFNKNERILCSIIDKSLHIVDTNFISERWIRKTFDYREQITKSRMPWLIGASTLMLLVLFLMTMLFRKSKMDSKRLELVVHERTKELELQTEAAQAASLAKSEFLSNTSHEIRTPMNAIIGMSELALREDASPTVREYMLEIKAAGTNLLSIINDILDFSKIESDKIEIAHAPYLFASLVNDVVNLSRVRIAEKSILFIVNVDPNIPNSVVGDEVRVRQILTNLLSNACKYTDQGFITLSITANFTAENLVMFNFTIADSGIGIKKEDQAQLFEKFTRVDMNKNKNVVGTGLGLSITRSLCHMMGGDVTVSSEYGKGSTFTATLLQDCFDQKSLASVVDAKNKHVLLHEKIMLYADSLSYTLNGLGVDTTRLDEEVEFLEQLKSDKYDFAFFTSNIAERTMNLAELTGVKTALVVLLSVGESLDFTGSHIVMPAFAIPVANILNGVIADKIQRNYEMRFIAPSANVLIVDDILTNLKVAQGLMSPYQTRVDTCLSGAEAIDLVRKSNYDIVFMDHMMPDMDGVETTAKIRAIVDDEKGEYFQKLPIIALTANAIVGMREMFLDNGFTDYLAKPIEMHKLNEIMDQWIPKNKRIKARAVESEPVPTAYRLPTIYRTDIEHGIAMTGGNEANYIDILKLFSQDAHARIASMQNVDAGADLTLFATNAHALKGAMASIGATQISEMAKELEFAGKRGDAEAINATLGVFLEELSKLADSIDCALTSMRTTADAKIDTEKINPEDLLLLKQAIETDDIFTVDELFARLTKMNLDEEDKKLLEEIADNMLISDVESALKCVSELLAK